MRDDYQISPQKPIEVLVQLAFLYYSDNTHTQSEMYALWAKKATFSCDYLLANSILLKGVLFQIIDSQESDRWLSPSHHLPSGQVAYFYYNTKTQWRKYFFI